MIIGIVRITARDILMVVAAAAATIVTVAVLVYGASTFTYHFWYKHLVKQTVREMVVDESLK
ncbi:hypothetical protein [Chrysiogenes arsenatis]|uniref:hypothetical protein n=1 Tax=Chrysiogenes arsenatis TaxID=309797 RepID=UPI0004068356|nr:hypothetical protein [Chrysiogenes arsenatis]